MWLQAGAGLLAWLIGVSLVVKVAHYGSATLGAFQLNQRDTILCTTGAVLIGIGALAIWLRLRYRWRGFLPGILIGFGLTCLLPIGIVWAICASKK
jgi:hypothetical protein